MSRKILIDPVTRIEGHAKITLHLSDAGEVEEARFHVTEFRGFEKFCEGRPFWEMPSLTGRICGICPVSHLMASAKAGDSLLGVRIPESAEKLRRLMNLGQIVQSHALSFFHLSAPDLLLGMDTPPEQRNVVGLAAHNRELVRAGIRLRQFGQDIIAFLGGKKIHPAWAVPGGVRSGLSGEHRADLQGRLDEMFATAGLALELWAEARVRLAEEVRHGGDFPSLFLGLVSRDGHWEHYDGHLQVMDSEGRRLESDLDPMEFEDKLGEVEESWSYLKFPYYKPIGYPEGTYRVGPLARLNLCRSFGTSRADKLLEAFRSVTGEVATASFDYHWARLIEIMGALERIERLLLDPDLNQEPLRARARCSRPRGVGVSEAPRGTLFHHYHADRNGLLTHVNLIIATGQNNPAMNRTIGDLARHFIRGPELSDGVLNRIEAGIRAYDPCLSCSTHALGQMPLQVQLLDTHGNVLQEVSRAL